MGQAETIRDFLISLGYKVDIDGQKKFNAAVDNTGKLAAGVAKKVAATAAATYAAVTAYAMKMEKTYYQSRLVGSSVNNINSLEAAWSKAGMSAEQFGQTINSFSTNLRQNPALVGFIKQMNIQTKGRDTGDIMMDVVEALKGLPHHVGFRFAEMFGIDERTFTMTKDAMLQIKEAKKAYSELQKQYGVDADKTAKSSAEYANAFRGLTDRMKLFGTAIATDVLPFVKDMTTGFSGLLDIGKQFYDWVFKSKDDGEKGFISKMIESWDEKNRKKEGSPHQGKLPDKPGTPSNTGTAPSVPSGQTTTRSAIDGQSGSSVPWKGNLPRGVRNNNILNIEYQKQRGATSDGRFARWNTAEEGLEATARQLRRFQAVHRKNTVAEIIGRWSPQSDKTNKPGSTQNYINYVSKAIGVDANDRINLNDPKMLSALGMAMARFESGKNRDYYSRAQWETAAQKAAGGKGQGEPSGVNVGTQNVNIHVNGAGNPEEVARRTADQVADQARKIKMMSRNTKPRIR